MSHNRLADLAETAAAALKAAALTYAEALIADTQTELNIAALADLASSRADLASSRATAVLDRNRAADTRAAARADAETLIAAARLYAKALHAGGRRTLPDTTLAGLIAFADPADLDTRAVIEAAAKANANIERAKARFERVKAIIASGRP